MENMTNKTDTRSMLLTASPWKLVLSLSVPAIIGMVVVGLYNLMDQLKAENR
jgi:Na+-driven multidrug efflux pump